MGNLPLFPVDGAVASSSSATSTTSSGSSVGDSSTKADGHNSQEHKQVLSGKQNEH